MRKNLLVVLLILCSMIVKADEGMWLPQLLESMNEKRMKSLGMKITAKDIYDINKGSLKDAIVSFGGFCTGEVVSDKGLVLTNHHCGFDAIQNHSTLDHNYIRDGFWARNNAEELTNPSLFVTFIVRIDDVTQQMLKGVNISMKENERQSVIDKNFYGLKETIKKASYQDAFVRAFYDGNKYYMFITETYKDVRLVGAPPSSIGNFGKDSDNWMWPRHTADFSVFRIYAGPDNKPAEYSPNNKPYIPKKSLKINLNGLKEGDFTMIFGFPGRTNEYLPSEAVRQIVEVNDPAKIFVRSKALAVIDKYMRADESIKIKYASKYARISNAWKKWQGEVLGLTKTNAVQKKKNYETAYIKNLQRNSELNNKYGTVLQQLIEKYKLIEPYSLSKDYYLEIISKVELFTIISKIKALQKSKEKNSSDYGIKIQESLNELTSLFSEYSTQVDKELFAAMMEIYIEKQQKEYIALQAVEQFKSNKENYQSWAENIYYNSFFVKEKNVIDALKNNPDILYEQLKTDPVAILINDMSDVYNNTIAGSLNTLQADINNLQRMYMQLQMDVMKNKNFYPDANSTLRVAFGNVNGYEPADGKKYFYYTYLDGVMEKYQPGDYEFDVPQKLIDLYKTKNYGQYGVNGKMPVCFIATNHTTGGNSGSPALDAYGNLVGINFDRVWEGTMSDINYDPSICRNIMVDIRYVLFIIDKYAGAGHLVKEMTIASVKK
ncbi:MAG: S46 family peptidase [Niabella sp.]